jgi:hypothetical protein
MVFYWYFDEITITHTRLKMLPQRTIAQILVSDFYCRHGYFLLF